jgi:long-subunit fatty acid transport protein
MRMTRAIGKHILVLAGALLVLAQSAPALADSGFVSPLSEIPLTNPMVRGARAAGMGFVAMAVADDATAMTTNPAAMARLQRVELSGGFRRNALNVDGEMAGTGFGTELSATDFSSLRFAYPFPTFRGSLVFGLSAERIYDFTDDRLAAYEDEISWQESPGNEQTGVWASREDYIADGGVTALSAACAVDVSPAISLGAALSYLSGEYSKTWRWDIYDDYDLSETYTDVHMAERYDADVSGLRATFGGLFYVAEGLSVGVALDTPVTLTFEGSSSDYIELVTTVPESSSVSEGSVLFSDKVTLPFAFRAGVAYAPVDLVVLGADVTYTDWSQMDYEGRITDTEDGADGLSRRTLYEEKVGFGLGAEVTVPSWPLRVRGGYAYSPMAYDGLEVTSERSYFTLGAGILIDTVLTVDVAWLMGSYTRTDDVYAFEEQVDDSALVLEASYRF